MELKSLYIEFHLCLNLIGFWKFLWSSVIQFVTISMNLFYQVVIVICDPIMKG